MEYTLIINPSIQRQLDAIRIMLDRLNFVYTLLPNNAVVVEELDFAGLCEITEAIKEISTR